MDYIKIRNKLFCLGVLLCGFQSNAYANNPLLFSDIGISYENIDFSNGGDGKELGFGGSIAGLVQENLFAGLSLDYVDGDRRNVDYDGFRYGLKAGVTDPKIGGVYLSWKKANLEEEGDDRIERKLGLVAQVNRANAIGRVGLENVETRVRRAKDDYSILKFEGQFFINPDLSVFAGLGFEDDDERDDETEISIGFAGKANGTTKWSLRYANKESDTSYRLRVSFDFSPMSLLKQARLGNSLHGD